MNGQQEKHHRSQLQRIARRVMLERGLLPDFSAQSLSELRHIAGPASADGATPKDLRTMLWCSIDIDDSRDLDQLTVALTLPDDVSKVFVDPM